MSYWKLCLIGAIASMSMACSNRVAFNSAGVMDVSGLDAEALVMAGYARAPGIPVRVMAVGCNGGSAVEIASAVSSTTGSFTADSTGQRGYAFSMTVDLLEEGYVVPETQPPHDWYGCVRLAMMERVGNSWTFVALFDGTAQTCRTNHLSNNPNATWMQQIAACKLSTAWARYEWAPFG